MNERSERLAVWDAILVIIGTSEDVTSANRGRVATGSRGLGPTVCTGRGGKQNRRVGASRVSRLANDPRRHATLIPNHRGLERIDEDAAETLGQCEQQCLVDEIALRPVR